MRGKAEIVEEKGRHKIVITEIPYQVYKSRIVEAIAEAHAEKRIAASRAWTTSPTARACASSSSCRRARRRKSCSTSSSSTRRCRRASDSTCSRWCRSGEPRADGSVAIEPQVLTLKQLLEHFIAHRKDVITRRTRYDLRKAEERAHLLEGYRIALDNIDEVIEIVRASQTTDEAKQRLSGALRALRDSSAGHRRHAPAHAGRARAPEDRGRIRRAASRRLPNCKIFSAARARIAQIVKTETLEVKKRFGDERRTDIDAGRRRNLDGAAHSEHRRRRDLHGRRLHQARLRRYVPHAKSRRTRRHRHFESQARRRRAQFLHDQDARPRALLYEQGTRYRLRGYEIPDTTRQARGTALVNLLTLPPGEDVTAVFPIDKFEGEKYMVMVTKHGVIKKTKLEEFANVRRNGLNAINLDENDELLAVDLSDGSHDIILASTKGMAVHFNEKDVRPMGRNARGVKAMTLEGGDTIVAMDVLEDQRREVLLVTSQAFGKRTPIEDYRHTSRGGKGVKAFAREREDIGQVVDQILVAPDDQILMITSRQPSDPPQGRRDPQGRPFDARACACSGWARATRSSRSPTSGKQAKQITDITGEPAEIEG